MVKMKKLIMTFLLSFSLLLKAQDTTICIKYNDSQICVPTYKHVFFKTVNKIDFIKLYNFQGTKILIDLKDNQLKTTLISDLGLKTFEIVLTTKENYYFIEVNNFIITIKERKKK